MDVAGDVAEGRVFAERRAAGVGDDDLEVEVDEVVVEELVRLEPPEVATRDDDAVAGRHAGRVLEDRRRVRLRGPRARARVRRGRSLVAGAGAAPAASSSDGSSMHSGWSAVAPASGRPRRGRRGRAAAGAAAGVGELAARPRGRRRRRRAAPRRRHRPRSLQQIPHGRPVAPAQRRRPGDGGRGRAPVGRHARECAHGVPVGFARRGGRQVEAEVAPLAGRRTADLRLPEPRARRRRPGRRVTVGERARALRAPGALGGRRAQARGTRLPLAPLAAIQAGPLQTEARHLFGFLRSACDEVRRNRFMPAAADQLRSS